ncbi:UbiA prenyltransferase family protein [uncultured Mailhella sp.]|uniref:UbiA prenyltransferase family protein n=1 Tax=uncultured Mailhella sp. TaxID=1981031 RepID=UPI0026194DF4|nr:UbiA prenyltransferase family protein [uncultured Mailhella sp.]
MTLNSLLRLMRIPHYTKNFFVFLPLFFSGQLFVMSAVQRSAVAFLAFCLAASSIYILNDILDREKDRLHPVKRKRPIASGEVSPRTGMVLAAVLALFLFLILRNLGSVSVTLSLAAYLVLNIFYVCLGRKWAIVDVCCIAIGFVLRVMAGNAAVGCAISPWLVMMVFLLSMFLGLGKRWDDLRIIEEEMPVGNIRESLNGYSRRFVLSSMTFLSAINTICYIMYTLSPENVARYGSSYLYATAFWVLLGNMRYLQIVLVNQNSMSPTKILIQDFGIQLCVLIWFVHIGILLY